MNKTIKRIIPNKITKVVPKVTIITTPIQKRRAPVSLRTSNEEIRYLKAKKKGDAGKPFLEEKRLKEWNYWAVIPNAFPYSAAFKVHHMLIPKRVVSQLNLSQEEQKELQEIINLITDEQEYDCMLTNFPRNQSNKEHFHIHLLVFKDRRKHLKF